MEADVWEEPKRASFFGRGFAFFLVFTLGVGAGVLASHFLGKTPFSSRPLIQIAFQQEIFELVLNEYWKKVSEKDLSDLHRRAIEKATGKPHAVKNYDWKGIHGLLESIFEGKSEKERNELTAKIGEILLANLEPFGRSKLYTTQDEKTLHERVHKKVTVYSHVVHPRILHVYIKSFSPETFDEFKKIVDEMDRVRSLNTLIFDMRGNVGGAIDYLQIFLGPFIGKDQYAYHFFRRGKTEPYKTQSGWLNSLVRYKKVVILVDQNTQSTAELVASTLKKYNVGLLMGTRTRGWGTVEKVFQLKQQITKNDKYSVFLVHTLTLREDGAAIEKNGIQPLIDLNQSGWEEKLMEYFNFKPLVSAVRRIWSSPPVTGG